MNSQEKSNMVESLKADFQHYPASFLIGIQGLTVEKLQLLRNQIRPYGKIKLAKNTLATLAARQVSGNEQLEPYFKDQVALVFVEKDTPGVAKILYNFAKENEKLKLVVGYLDKQVLTQERVVHLASLPSREVLMGRICGLLKSPAIRLAWLLQQKSTQQ